MLRSAFILFFVVATTAHAQESLVFYVPEKAKESDDSRKKRTAEARESLRQFTNLTFLGADDTKAYQSNIQALIGNYFYIKDKGTPSLELIGKGTAAIKEIKTEIKDGVLFRAIVQDKWNAGLALPFLAVKLGKEQVAELSVQENVAVVTDKPEADLVACGFPISWEEEAKTKQFYFLTAATVTSISSRKYDATNGEGSGAFSIVKLDGKYFFSDEMITKQNVVAIAKIPVKVLSAEQKKSACKVTEKKEVKTVLGIDSIQSNKDLTTTMPSISRLDEQVDSLRGQVFGVESALR